MTDIEMTKLASLAERANQSGADEFSFAIAANPTAIKSLIERVRIAELERDEAVRLLRRAENIIQPYTQHSECADAIDAFLSRISGTGDRTNG